MKFEKKLVKKGFTCELYDESIFKNSYSYSRKFNYYGETYENA